MLNPLCDQELVGMLNALYRFISLMVAEIIAIMERARYVRDHLDGYDSIIPLNS